MDDIPTLDDIARQSGFSKSTVSLALRHHPRIPEATRRVIETVAAKINYRPDPALARIAANRWRRVPLQTTIAFVTNNHPNGTIIGLGAIHGASQRATVFGYRIEHFRVEDCGSPKRLGEVIHSRGINGVIVGKIFEEGFAENFPWQHFAVVGCDNGFIRPPIQVVMPNHAHAVHRAWSEASARGYRRIGMVLFREYTAVDYFDKLSAYLFCQRDLPANSRLSVGHFDHGNDDALQAWLRREKPDAILGFNVSIYLWLSALGYSIPRDFGFVALMGGETPSSDLTRLRENTELIGQIAVDQLDVLLRTNQYGLPGVVCTLMTESLWMPGTTLPSLIPKNGRK